MGDIVSPSVRSRMMQGIRGRDTTPECALRSLLFRSGFRFRLHRRDLPGRPDIVLPKHQAAIFVHGCFWHRHSGCSRATTPSTNYEFWQVKFSANIARDERNLAALRQLGWRIAVVWECALRGQQAITTARAVSRWLQRGDKMLELPSPQGRQTTSAFPNE
ncbi:MAG: DNA mismatch endonuclease Vsr [Betaproteobacteria bacterium]|nr:DNA mismatch endonuclease Vsr [Betaproteobacteria bacterium]